MEISQVKRKDEGILSLSLGHNIRVLKWVHVDVEVHLTWNKGRELSGGRPAELQLLTPAAHDARPPNTGHLATSIIIHAMSHASR
jgi:hypothetical protein